MSCSFHSSSSRPQTSALYNNDSCSYAVYFFLFLFVCMYIVSSVGIVSVMNIVSIVSVVNIVYIVSRVSMGINVMEYF